MNPPLRIRQIGINLHCGGYRPRPPGHMPCPWPSGAPHPQRNRLQHIHLKRYPNGVTNIIHAVIEQFEHSNASSSSGAGACSR
eukprot:10207668-Karenia_brevis.AAC.1